MGNFINDYYITPIVEGTGYNIVNTVTYAAFAVLLVYCVYRALKGKVGFGADFVLSVCSFILFGSTVRVVTDSIQSGAFTAVTPLHGLVLGSHLYDYGFFTASPGIYVVTFALFLASLGALYALKRLELHKYVGLALWLPHFLLLVPFMDYAVYALPVLLLAALPAYVALRYFRDPILAGIVAGHALDGAATFFAIDYFSRITGISYFEQHVLSGAIGLGTGSYFTFYLVKVAISFAAAYLLMKEQMDPGDRNFLAAGLMVMGFGPGIRDVLRMVCGA